MLHAGWLETFATLCETGSYTEAARRMHMTQPGVSQHVRKLTEQVGVDLVQRRGRGFVLTSAGRAIRELAVDRQQQERDLLEALRPDDPDRGEIRLASSGSIALLVHPSLLTLMRERPHLTVHLEATPQPRIIDGLLRGRFRLAVMHAEPENPRLHRERLGREELCLVVPESSPPRPSFAELEALGFVAHPDAFRYAEVVFSRNYADAFISAERLRRRTFVNQIGQILEPVAHGLGYTLMPRSGVDAFRNGDRLRVADLPERVQQPLWLVWTGPAALPARYGPVITALQQLAAPLAAGRAGARLSSG